MAILRPVIVSRLSAAIASFSYSVTVRKILNSIKKIFKVCRSICRYGRLSGFRYSAVTLYRKHFYTFKCCTICCFMKQRRGDLRLSSSSSNTKNYYATDIDLTKHFCKTSHAELVEQRICKHLKDNFSGVRLEEQKH